MPTVIESLVIELGLDPKKFTQGQKDALENFKRGQDQAISFGKNIEREGQRVGDVFSKLKTEALGLVTIFLGGKGIKDFVSNVTSLDAATGRVAYTLNQSAREVSAWEGASAQLGGQVGGITSAMQGLSGAMNQFMLTGQGPFLAVMTHLGISLFDQNGRLKTASTMFLEIADSVHKLNQTDPARAAATLSMIPGANQDSINLMIKGRSALEALLNEARKAGGTTQDSAEAAAEYQKQLALLDRSATSFGRTLLTMVAPGLAAVFGQMTKLLNAWRAEPGGDADKLAGANLRKKTTDWFGDPKNAWRAVNRMNPWGVSEEQLNKELDEFYGTGDASKNAAKAVLAAKMAQKPEGGPGTGGTGGTEAEQEAYIRKAAMARGVDPDVAVKVWTSEGRYGVGPSKQSTVINSRGQREESYGPFQLYMNGGKGNEFQKKTGLDPRDPDTFKQQVDFALDEAVKGGWGPWHGWKGLPRAGLPSLGGAPSVARNSSPGRQSELRGGDAGGSQSTTVSIGKVEIMTKATDADGIANEIPASLKRANWAASANYGLSG
jgi:hypothetical protein